MLAITFTNLQWSDISIICAILTTVVAAATYVVSRAFDLGKMSHRIETVEQDVKELKVELRKSTKELSGRIDDVLKLLANRA